MASLTDSARVSRIVIKWGLVGLVALMVGRMIIGGLISMYKKAHPVVAAPTVGFGALPPITFPKSEYDTPMAYKLETVTGRLPTMPTQADVLLMASTRPNLLAMERSITEANSLGFTVQPEKVSDLVYRWRIIDQIPSTLTMKIYDGRFVWDTAWATNPNFLVEKQLPSREQAIKDVYNLLGKVGEATNDLAEDESVVTYLKGAGGAYQSADSLSDADFIRIDLFRKKYKETFAFVTPRAEQGTVRVILSSNSKAGKVVRMEYNYFPIDYTVIETYPLRPVQQAWEELQAGKGFVAQIDNGISAITIRKVTLAYFDSFEPQKYIQPVYVFSGDNHFVGYVQAVKDAKTTTN